MKSLSHIYFYAMLCLYLGKPLHSFNAFINIQHRYPSALSKATPFKYLGQKFSSRDQNTALDNDKKKIVFLGTPDVAALSLDILNKNKEANGYEIVAVVTQPPAPSGRNRKLTPSPVQSLAESINISVLSPVKANEVEFLNILREYQPDLCITAAYGNFLPSKFLSIPKYGTLNIHPSLLPKYRGAAPVPRCLEKGDPVTGVTVLFTVLKMDAGPIVSQIARPLDGNEKTTDLLSELFVTGTNELIRVLPSIWSNSLSLKNQTEEEATHASKMNVSEAMVDFSKMSAEEIHNKCRAFSIWPGTWSMFTLGDSIEPVRIKIITTKVLSPSTTTRLDNREIEYVNLGGNQNLFKVKCFDGSELGILELQPPGKKAMDAKAYNNGLRGLQQVLRWCPVPESSLSG